MSDALKIVRAAIPDADMSMINHIVWGRTPFPFSRVTAKEIYKAADGYRRAGAKGITLCDHCERPARPRRFECQRCFDALTGERRSALKAKASADAGSPPLAPQNLTSP